VERPCHIPALSYQVIKIKLIKSQQEQHLKLHSTRLCALTGTLLIIFINETNMLPQTMMACPRIARNQQSN
jgi:hypothetical protein